MHALSTHRRCELMTTTVIVVLIVVTLIVAGSIFGVRRGLDRRARGGSGDDPEMTRAYQDIARDIDRGKSAGRGF